MTTIALNQSRCSRICAGMPTCVCLSPSLPRSPDPCMKRITGSERCPSYVFGTYTWYFIVSAPTVTVRSRKPVGRCAGSAAASAHTTVTVDST